MPRIIAGSARGRRLAVPSAGTRPTADAVREAMFATLTSRWGDLAGAAVLDLYAGSGALGLEAASRGASRAVLVESDRRAAAVLAGNVEQVGLSGVSVVRTSVGAYLRRPPARPFDLVIADPPYAAATAAFTQLLQTFAAEAQVWLADHAAVLLERSSRDRAELAWPAGFEPWPVRRYGEASVHAATWSAPEPAERRQR